MQDQEVINVRHGIWIEERWLRRAGLGSRLQVVTGSGGVERDPYPILARRSRAAENI